MRNDHTFPSVGRLAFLSASARLQLEKVLKGKDTDKGMAELQVVHNAAATRFEVSEGRSLAELVYQPRPGVMVFVHTSVPSEMEGRGIGGKLARAGLAFAKSEGLRVEPRCPFVASYVKRHPEYLELVTDDYRKYLSRSKED